MGLLDFFRNQPQMADPHANARRLMGGAVQAQPAGGTGFNFFGGNTQENLGGGGAMNGPQPQGTQQEVSMTPYQQPQNIGSGVMGFDHDLTGINNMGHQAGPETQTYLTGNGGIDTRQVGGYDEKSVEKALNYEYDSLGWKDDNANIYSDGQVLQGQGNNTGYIPMNPTDTFTDVEGQSVSGYPKSFVEQKEAGGAVKPVGPKPQPADIPLSVITGDTNYNIPTQAPESLLGTGGDYGFENLDEEAILKLLQADNKRTNTQKFLDRGRDLFGLRNTKKY